MSPSHSRPVNELGVSRDPIRRRNAIVTSGDLEVDRTASGADTPPELPKGFMGKG